MAAAAALSAWLFLILFSHYESTALKNNSNTMSMSTGWIISDGVKTLYENSTFDKIGWLKKQNRVVLTKTLPETWGKSISFTTIGYRVDVFIDEQSIYSFGSSPDGNDVWGVKTHIIKIPDSNQSRMLRLQFSTNHPANIAVSKYIQLDNVLSHTNFLFKSSLFKISFSLLYISIGVSILLYSVITLAFRLRRLNQTLLMLAFAALFIGIRILFNITFVAFYTGPVFVFWTENVLKLAIPVPVLLFAAADKGLESSKRFVILAAVLSAFLLIWVICEFLSLNLFLLVWYVPLFFLTAIILMTTLIREFMTKTGRPELFAAVLALLAAAVADARNYFLYGSCDSMDYAITICAFPVLVLLIGKVVLNSVQLQLGIINENKALHIKGEFLFKNYNGLNQYIEETKKIWHDIDKHYRVIGSMVAEGDYDELKSYLAAMGHDMKKVKSSYICDNKLVNAILTHKFADAESAGINVGFSGNLPEHLNIRDIDLCSLLVNMLDNAIEACKKLPCGKEKNMDIVLGMKNDFIYFSVSNPSVEAPYIQDDKWLTSKEDKAKHGYGISILQKITQNYDGAFDIISSEGSFMVRAALKNTL